MWILILIVLAVVVYFVMSQASSSNQSSKASSRTKASKASSQNYSQVDYSNLEVSLESDVPGQDYTHLRNLLAEGKWKEADKETGRMMLLIGMIEKQRIIREGEYIGSDSGREDCLTISSFRFLPCKDICTIDRLWLKYSNGRFGFSVQKRIASEIRDNALSILLSGLEKYNYEADQIGRTLERRIGWYTPSDEMKIHNDLTFSIQAPYGHLPTANYCSEGISYSRKNMSFETEEVFGHLNLLAILNRLSICGIAL